MKNKTTTYFFQDMPIRVINHKGKPWFVASDVCRVLELHIKVSGKANTTAALQGFVESERRLFKVDTLGGFQNQNAISESGLYRVILRSKSCEAEGFQDWVTKIVLPDFRKDCGYVKGEEKVTTGEMSEDEFIFKAFDMLKNKAERLSSIVETHLKFLSVAEWAALNHLYLRQNQRVELGQAASYLCRQNGIEIRKQNQQIASWRPKEDISVGVYPKHILDEAALLVGVNGHFALDLGAAA